MNRIHSIRQTQITDRLAGTIDRSGIRSVELAIGTSKGVKVVDVAWMSSERFAEIDAEAEPTPIAPELCVDVVLASNTEEEMDEKRTLYFEAVAEEVWLVDETGLCRSPMRPGRWMLRRSRQAFPISCLIRHNLGWHPQQAME